MLKQQQGKLKDNTIDGILNSYLDNLQVETIKDLTIQHELEVRFGTAQSALSLKRQDYDNVIRHLYASGFEPCDNNLVGTHYLRISSANRNDPQIPKNLRIELLGNDIIQDYCRNNHLRACLENPAHSTPVPHADFSVKMKTTEKNDAISWKTKAPIQEIRNEDYHFRVSYKFEKDTLMYHAHQPQLPIQLDDWNDKPKFFRFLKRIRFCHPQYAFHVDVTLVKSGTGNSMTDAGIMRKEPTYEVEIEMDPSRAKSQTLQTMASQVRQGIRIILSAWQNTMYPIPWKEQERVLAEYQQVIETKDNRQPRVIIPHPARKIPFFGPKSITLQKHHLLDIQQQYTVTDKADGERHLLLIASNGRIYLINQNLQVIYTGYSVKEVSKLKHVLMDGEYIPPSTTHRQGRFAAFDIYFAPKEGSSNSSNSSNSSGLIAVHTKPFTQGGSPDSMYRLALLDQWMRMLNQDIALSQVNGDCSMIFACKTFYGVGNVGTGTCSNYVSCDFLHEGANKIWQDRLQMFDYNLDGLIYTPSHTDITGTTLKWKPPEYNTIDFLVTIQQQGKKEWIREVAETGQKYKTLILRCGFKTDIYPEPFKNMLQDTLPFMEEIDELPFLQQHSSNRPLSYKPIRFIPSDPYMEEAYLSFIEPSKDGKLYTLHPREIIENHSIVEFQYDANEKNPKWRWKPLRVRHDKTAQLRNHHNNFGNDYRVADSNWYSIHYPVTAELLTQALPPLHPPVEEDQVYYKNNGEHFKNTEHLRHFHNYIKQWLIQSAVQMSNKRDNKTLTLLDLSVGKGGDLGKWMGAGIAFVLGVDYAKDNILNNIDGACARYVQNRVKYPQSSFRAVFLQGNSALNYRDGSAFTNEPTAQSVAATLLYNSDNPNDEKTMKTYWKEISDRKYDLVRTKMGIGRDGFHITSCQFSLHYFFANAESLHGFLRNVAENTRKGGYFIGTCYDGQTVFERLKKQNTLVLGEMEKKDLYFRLEKKYSHETFHADASCLGYPIGVYQEHINQDIDEYLVHFDYFKNMMKIYGFDLAESEALNGKPAWGMFESLYRNRPQYSRKPMNMSTNEETISFLNRYFIFQKSDRPIDAQKVANDQIAIAAQQRLTPSSKPKETKPTKLTNTEPSLTKVTKEPAKARKVKEKVIVKPPPNKEI